MPGCAIATTPVHCAGRGLDARRVHHTRRWEEPMTPRQGTLAHRRQGYAMSKHTPLAPVQATDVETDLLVVGTGTGLFAALAAREAGLDVVVVEKTSYVGGSTALSGGAF